MTLHRKYFDTKYCHDLLKPYVVLHKKQSDITRILSRIKKELTENQVTLTNLFNMCLKLKNPKAKPCSQIRPKSAINRFKRDSGDDNPDIMKSKIDSGIMRQVLEKIGIFIPVEEFENMLSAFRLDKHKQIAYPDFIRVFVKTDYPQPFTRPPHIEAKEEYASEVDFASTRKSINFNATNFNSLSKSSLLVYK